MPSPGSSNGTLPRPTNSGAAAAIETTAQSRSFTGRSALRDEEDAGDDAGDAGPADRRDGPGEERVGEERHHHVVERRHGQGLGDGGARQQRQGPEEEASPGRGAEGQPT